MPQIITDTDHWLSLIWLAMGGGGGGGWPNLQQVLTNGDDAGGLNIDNLNILVTNAIRDNGAALAISSNSGDLTMTSNANIVNNCERFEVTANLTIDMVSVFDTGITSVGGNVILTGFVFVKFVSNNDIRFETIDVNMDTVTGAVTGNVNLPAGSKAEAGGRLTAGDVISTSNPGAGAGKVKLGTVQPVAVPVLDVNYLEQEVDGALIKIATLV